MGKSWYPLFIEDVEKYKVETQEVENGNKSSAQFKPLGAAMGVYEQRQKGLFMERIRIPAGVLQVRDLRTIYRIAKEFQIPYIHLTTRQDLQYHGLSVLDSGQVMERLLEEGLVTKGGGGNQPRNVACSPLSGVETNEVFDVTSYALSVCHYIYQNLHSYDLPRKYKIAFSNHPADTANSTVTDLGFVATTVNGEEGFQVFGGGGLGRNPAVGIQLAERISKEDVLYYVEAMKQLFEAEGDRNNRNKARIRHIVARVGEDEFKKIFEKYLQIVKEEYEIKLPKLYENVGLDSHILPKFNEYQVDLSARIIAQKQQGYYCLYVHPTNGNISLDELEYLLDVLEQEEITEIRLSMSQGFYVRNLTLERAIALEKATAQMSGIYPIELSVACTGASTCQLGIANSQALLQQIIRRFATENEAVKKALPSIQISGCPNSCGAHQIGAIGFSGRIRTIGEEKKEVYTLYFGGKKFGEHTTLGTPYQELETEEIPEFLVSLAKRKVESEIQDFYEFVGEILKS